MARYIDAERIKYTEYINGDVTVSKDLVEKIPTADVQEVRHAKFELIDNGKGVCSNCHRLDSIDNLAKYCRYCGALMDGKEIEEKK